MSYCLLVLTLVELVLILTLLWQNKHLRDQYNGLRKRFNNFIQAIDGNEKKEDKKKIFKRFGAKYVPQKNR